MPYLNITNISNVIPFDATYFFDFTSFFSQDLNFSNHDHLDELRPSQPKLVLVLGENNHYFPDKNPYIDSDYLQNKYGSKSLDLLLEFSSNSVTDLLININDSVTNSLAQLNITIEVLASIKMESLIIQQITNLF